MAPSAANLTTNSICFVTFNYGARVKEGERRTRCSFGNYTISVFTKFSVHGGTFRKLFSLSSGTTPWWNSSYCTLRERSEVSKFLSRRNIFSNTCLGLDTLHATDTRHFYIRVDLMARSADTFIYTERQK